MTRRSSSNSIMDPTMIHAAEALHRSNVPLTRETQQEIRRKERRRRMMRARDPYRTYRRGISSSPLLRSKSSLVVQNVSRELEENESTPEESSHYFDRFVVKFALSFLFMTDFAFGCLLVANTLWQLQNYSTMDSVDDDSFYVMVIIFLSVGMILILGSITGMLMNANCIMRNLRWSMGALSISFGVLSSGNYFTLFVILFASPEIIKAFFDNMEDDDCTLFFSIVALVLSAAEMFRCMFAYHHMHIRSEPPPPVVPNTQDDLQVPLLMDFNRVEEQVWSSWEPTMEPSGLIESNDRIVFV